MRILGSNGLVETGLAMLSKSRKTDGWRHREGNTPSIIDLQAALESLTLMHAGPDDSRSDCMGKLARVLSSLMKSPLVIVASRDAASAELRLLGVAIDGTVPNAPQPIEPGYSRGSDAVSEPPASSEQRYSLSAAELLACTSWGGDPADRELRSSTLSVSATKDGGQLVLVMYFFGRADMLPSGIGTWSQLMSGEIARLWSEYEVKQHSYAPGAQRSPSPVIHWDILNQPSKEDLYQALADHIGDMVKGATVDIYAINRKNHQFQRVALVGPMIDAIRKVPFPWNDNFDLRARVITQALASGLPVAKAMASAGLGVTSNGEDEESVSWCGVIGCWPLFSRVPGEVRSIEEPAGVITIVAPQIEEMDEGTRTVLDEISRTASFAIGQHTQRQALVREKARQTYLALHDAMTHLPNRRSLERHLEGLHTASVSRRNIFALGLLDLDDLKPINDRYGHSVGDCVLIEVANRLRRSLRADDYIARLGGDEFVMVIYNLPNENELEPLFEHVWDEIHRPIIIEDVVIQLEASLGVAVSTPKSRLTGDQLLRRADQAMYQIKSQKRDRTKWWLIGTPDEHLRVHAASEIDHALLPYGRQVSHLLDPLPQSHGQEVRALVNHFYTRLLARDYGRPAIQPFPAAVIGRLKRRLHRHLLRLFDPVLTPSMHEAMARHSGFFYAANGIEEPVFFEASAVLRELMVGVSFSFGADGGQAWMDVLLKRFDLDYGWQLESIRELQRQRIATLTALNTLAWSAFSYMDLIQGVVDILISHQEVKACAIGRPDASGKLVFEAVAGDAPAAYFFAHAKGEVPSVSVDANQPHSGGPNARAWRTGVIQRSQYVPTDPTFRSWRDIMRTQGLKSAVAIPLCQKPGSPAAVLSLYNSHFGAFHGKDQKVFIEQIQLILNRALARLAPPRVSSDLLPFFVRDAWRAMIDTGVVEIHYQPMISLAEGRVAGVEALARLREHDGGLVLPGRFLPALRESDLLRLFREVLCEAIECQRRMADLGYPIEMSINVPAAALNDRSYAMAASNVLMAMEHTADHLLLEILESAIGSEHSMPGEMVGMTALKSLGFRLVEDDLGAGYSSLIRLRQYPFDRMKIDCEIVRQVSVDPMRTLSFVRQLIRLGQDQGLEVVMEGLETVGLIEAAKILGATFGQGYAIARAMSEFDLRDWMRRFELDVESANPRTAAGTLAKFLLWEEQLLALPEVPVFWRRHTKSGSTSQLGAVLGQCDELSASYALMLEAAAKGPFTSFYRNAREDFIARLVPCVVAEECRR